MKTVGERTFEDYLDARGIKYEFERLAEGKKRPPDYTVFHDREYVFEVKDFEPTDVPEAGAYDAYARIRSKIECCEKVQRHDVSGVRWNGRAPQAPRLARIRRIGR